MVIFYGRRKVKVIIMDSKRTVFFCHDQVVVKNWSGVICVEKRCFRLGSISPNSWRKSQMHQKHSLATVGAVQFHQQNYTQLHHCWAQLEYTLNFYGVLPTPCASTISVNLLAQEQRVKCWMKLTPEAGKSCRPRATVFHPLSLASHISVKKFLRNVDCGPYVSFLLHNRVISTRWCRKISINSDESLRKCGKQYKSEAKNWSKFSLFSSGSQKQTPYQKHSKAFFITLNL